MQRHKKWPHALAALALAMSLATGHFPAAHAQTLSDNTGQTASGDAVSVDQANWAGASFTTSAAYSQASISATLLASNAGSATLSLFGSDSSGLIPSAWLADFTLAATTGGSTTFKLEGSTALSSAGTYWLVLRNDGDTTLWSWTASSDGSGTGFTGNWANSDDAGATWFTNSALYPVQMKVELTGETISSVPEPATWALTLVALPWLAGLQRHRSAQPRPGRRAA